MDERTRRISDLLHEAGEVHHVVYRITDGADDDWASFYADWLIDHSELPATLGRPPTRSHLVHELVDCERAFAQAQPGPRWQDFYAERIVQRFGCPQALLGAAPSRMIRARHRETPARRGLDRRSGGSP